MVPKTDARRPCRLHRSFFTPCPSNAIMSPFLEPLVHPWGHFVGAYRQKLTASPKITLIEVRRALRGSNPLSLPSLVLSDTKVCEPSIRARLGTTAGSCASLSASVGLTNPFQAKSCRICTSKQGNERPVLSFWGDEIYRGRAGAWPRASSSDTMF